MKNLEEARDIIEYAIRKACLYCWEGDEVPRGRFNAAKAQEIATDLLEILYPSSFPSQQYEGQKKLRVNNTSGYLGVSAHGKKWAAWCAGRYLGVYDTPQDGARAYDQAMLSKQEKPDISKQSSL